ncbi:DNA modification methylase [Halogranum rubrum]|uniref:Type II methyltransferase n=1 Tax=Halogranum rubrum TaxID=553466 RepID=A0A1I4EIF7_9EURY|nr:site-specific DNA-methyltransferase [Halogranum rubrum]SFL05522.1 DNA modification methylase [Halogranum rubrum]
METDHRVVVEDSRQLSRIEDDAVELVVTSPPYPMIEMWDGLFSELNPAVRDELDAENGQAAFELMHSELDEVWSEVARVLVDGGIACINVGDATRKLDGSFRVYQNHSRIINAFEDRGFEPLPEVLWRKPVNSGAKFMGSGMLPPNAYVTLEHEYILNFRNGKTQRKFEPGSERRYNSAYFWEERNQWFSDVWTDVRGEHQSLTHDDLRDRSAAYPFEIPYRLVNMYSVYGDTVLDPFWGTGTTSLAAMTAGRSSIGYELDEQFTHVFDERVSDVAELTQTVIRERLDAHHAFVEEKIESGTEFNYDAENYEFPVTTKQERPIQFYAVESVERTDEGYRAVHEPFEGDAVRR